jgi:acetylornithine deacetylase
MTIEQVLLKLISIPSASGREGGIRNYVKKYLNDLHFRPRDIEGNLLLKIPGKTNCQSIIFNAHLDTVDVGNLADWKYSPWGQKVAGKIYGLGSSDEKCTVAVLLKLAEYYSTHQPEIDVWLMWVINEEVDGSGTDQALKWFKAHYDYSKSAVVLGEPTDLETLEIAHKGNIFIKVTIPGDSGHGSQPISDTSHAVFKMLQWVGQAESIFNGWQAIYKDKLLGSVTIAKMTAIKAGNIQIPNKFPDYCETTFDIRTTPKLTARIVQTELAKISSNAKVDFVYPPVDGGFTQENEAIVKVAKEITNLIPTASTSSNDLGFFTKLGIPGIVFGPGNSSVIHKANEYCDISNLKKCIQIYEKIISDYSKDDCQ